MTSAHSAPWLLCRLLAALDGDTDLPGELRLAVGPHGVRDRERLVLTVLGVMAYARRAGCRATEVRQAVTLFAQMALDGRLGRAVVARCAQRCAAVVDAVYLLYGPDAAASDPLRAVREVAPLLTSEPRPPHGVLPRRW